VSQLVYFLHAVAGPRLSQTLGHRLALPRLQALGRAEDAEMDRCASPHARTASPDTGVLARSLAIGSAAPR